MTHIAIYAPNLTNHIIQAKLNDSTVSFIYEERQYDYSLVDVLYRNADVYIAHQENRLYLEDKYSKMFERHLQDNGKEVGQLDE